MGRRRQPQKGRNHSRASTLCVRRSIETSSPPPQRDRIINKLADRRHLRSAGRQHQSSGSANPMAIPFGSDSPPGGPCAESLSHVPPPVGLHLFVVSLGAARRHMSPPRAAEWREALPPALQRKSGPPGFWPLPRLSSDHLTRDHGGSLLFFPLFYSFIATATYSVGRDKIAKRNGGQGDGVSAVFAPATRSPPQPQHRTTSGARRQPKI